MADTYSADIIIGGKIKRSDLDQLWDAIAEDGAFDPETDQLLDPDDWDTSSPGYLSLYDSEAAWGHFSEIERVCQKLGLRYVRWSEDGDRQVFDGEDAHDVTATPDGKTVLTADHLERFATIDEALAWLRRMDENPPALEIVEG